MRRNLHFDLMSDSHDKRQMLPVSTSGATGEPLTLYAEKTQLEMRWATTLRNQEWTGYRFGDRQVAACGTCDLGRPRLQALRERLDAVLARRAVVARRSRWTATGCAAPPSRCAGIPRALVSGDAAALQ